MSSGTNSAPEARVGEIIDDRYRLVEHLADGGMASVYRAEHVNTRAPFAIKVLRPEFSRNREVSGRFQREVQAYRCIQHAHVVSASDFGKLSDGCLYMVLEYVEGKDLYTELQHKKPFDAPRAVRIALQVTRALVAAHAAGVVHRDLKPENIMLIERDGDKDYVKLVDFGIAKMPTRGQPLTALGSIFGTPEYMAPEQARGVAVDHRSDLYTLGIVLYEMLAGNPPFKGREVDEVILAQISKPAPALPATLPRALRDLVMQLLQKEPGERIQTAAELAERLQKIFDELTNPTPVEAPKAPKAQPAQTTAPAVPDPEDKSSGASWLVVGVLLAVIVGVVAALLKLR